MRAVVIAAALVVLVGLGLFVWPTLWAVEGEHPLQVTRTHRLTGERQVRTDTGWEPAVVVSGPGGVPPSVLPLGEAARAGLRELATGIDLYRMTNKRLPDALADLMRVDERNPEPFVTKLSQDPWGHAYDYLPEGNRSYQLRSRGADGRPDTGDDLWWPPK